MRIIRKSLLATSCALALAGPAAANIVTEAFDGAFVDARDIGQNKGLLLDYIPEVNTTFGAFFSYDNAGNQVWSSFAIPMVEGRVDYTNVNLFRYSGGRWNERGAPLEAVFATANISFTCDGVAVNISPNTGTGLANVNFVFTPLSRISALECNNPVAACPAGTTADGSDCRLPSSITGNLFLPAGKKYIVRGQVSVENNGRLTIAPGVTVQGSTDRSSPNFIAVRQGGRLYAEGTRTQPITFTGPEATPGSWAGLVLNGRSICNDATATTTCRFEAVPDLVYGAVPPVLDDNSGALRYVRILWAGQQIAPNEELNSLTLNAVGSGTILEYVQVDGGLDDGFEWFGGSVNGKYLVCSNMGDDCFDFDQGFNGKIQFALGWQGINPDQGGDSNGIESDNDNPASDKLPRTQPSMSNLTMVGRADVGNEGMRIRRGSGGNYANVVVAGFRDRCINLIDAQTYALSSATQTGSTLTMTQSWVGSCVAGQFEDNASAAYAVSAWYNAGAGNGTGDPLLVSGGFLPTATSPILVGGQAPADGFFRPVQYRGAFAGPRDNWTADWTVRIPR